MTPGQRILRARIAAHAMHSQGKTNTTAARDAFDRKFELEVDPEGVLSPAERAKRATHARAAHFLRLSAKGVAARQTKTG